MDRSSSWTNAARNADFAPPSRVARMAMPSPRPPPGSTAEAVATARRSEYGAGGSILPVLPSASPNASKRSSWTTPRSSPVDSMDDDFHQPSSQSFAPPPRRAEVASMAAARRAEPTRQCSVSDGLFASETEQAQLAYMEQMYGTINLLNAELEAERRQRAALETAAARPSTYPAKTNYLSVEEDVHIPMGDFDEPPTGFVVSQTPVAPSYSPRKLRTMPSPPSHPPQTQHRVARPPVSPRAIAKEQDEELCATLGKNAELRIRSRDMERTVEKAELELELARKQIKMAERRAENREEKLRALLKEKLSWQKELKVTRAQVVEEKMRQVDLFREVEGAKRHFAAELEAVEQELRSAQEENTQLRTHAAEMKAQINFQTRKMEEMARQAQDEKARFVAMVEDTRHRFREWKEGEAEAIQTAHDLVVRNLKTEYDLKIERHQDEKQKLRDKVNDLEVSMRLLQKDRALSPLELSLRKATILGSKEHTGAIAAEQIETQSRILELENMLVHSQEYQARQESIIKLSEATISRLMQEREVTALENLSLHPFGVEPQPRIEDLSYETHLAGYVTAPSSPARPPGTPPRAHQIPVVKSNEPSVVRSPKSRSHTPRRADLEVSIAQAAEQDSMTNQSANTGSAVPSSREQSLIDELEQLRKALAEAQAKAEAAAKQEVVDMPEVHSGSVSLDENAHSADAADSTIPTKSVEAPIPQDNGRAENSVDADTQNETMTEIKAEDTPEAEDEKHTDPNPTDTATKVPCESPLPAETVSFRDADEERHSDNIVSDVVSADEIHAASSTTEDIEDSREAALNESGLSENLSSDSQSEDTIIADGPSAQEEENISNEISTTGLRDFTGCSDDPVDKVDAHEEDEAPPSPNKFHGDINDVCVVDNEIANSKGTEDAFENTDDAPAKEELVHERESELSDRTVVVADLGLGDDPVPDESDAAPLATTNVELVEETDRPSQLSTEDPVADSNNSGIEDQDQPSRDNAEQVDNSVEPPNTTQGSVCSAAEVLGDENVGTVAAMSTSDGPFASEAPQTVTELENAAVHEHVVSHDDSAERQEDVVELSACASDIVQSEEAAADAIEDTPTDVGLPHTQVPGNDNSLVIGSEGYNLLSSDVMNEAPENLMVKSNIDMQEQSEDSAIPALNDIGASINDETHDSDNLEPEVGSLNSVESLMASPAETDPGKVMEDSKEEAVETCEDLSTSPPDSIENEPMGVLKESVEAPVANCIVDDNAVEDVVAVESCTEASNASSDVVGNEPVEAPAESVGSPIDIGNACDNDVVEDNTQSVAEPCEDVLTSPADVVENELVEAITESFEPSTGVGIVDNDVDTNCTQAEVDSCEKLSTLSFDVAKEDVVEDETQVAIDPCEELLTNPSETAESELEFQAELVELPGDKGIVEIDVVEGNTQVVVDPCEDALNTVSEVVEHEPAEVPKGSVEAPVEAGTVEDNFVGDDTKSMTEPHEEVSNVSSDVVDDESVEEVPTASVEAPVENDTVEVDAVENDTHAAVKACAHASLETLNELNEPSVLEVPPEGFKEEIVADPFESSNNEAGGSENVEDVDNTTCPAAFTETEVSESLKCEGEGGNQIVLGEEPSQAQQEVELDSPYTIDRQVLPKEVTCLVSSVETPEACMAKAVVAVVELTALSFVAALHKANHTVLDAVAGGGREESASLVTGVVSENDSSGPICILTEREDPVPATSVANDAIVAEVVAPSDCGVPMVCDNEVDTTVDIDVPETAGGDVNAIEEHLTARDDHPEISFDQETQIIVPSKDPGVETGSVVALTTKAFAENFVKEVMEIFASTVSSDGNQEVDEADTKASVVTESVDEDIAILPAEVSVEKIKVETSAPLATNDANENVTDAMEDVALAVDVPLADDEGGVEALDPYLVPSNSEASTTPTQCEALVLDETVNLCGPTTVSDNAQLVELDEPETDEAELGSDENMSALEQIDDTYPIILEQDGTSTRDATAEFVPAVDTLALAEAFVADIEGKALTTIISWLQKESGSENARGGEYWDNEELESNSTRSIIGSWNPSEEQNETNVTSSEADIPFDPSSEDGPTVEPAEDVDVIDEVVTSLVHEVVDDLLSASDPNTHEQSQGKMESLTFQMDIAQNDCEEMIEREELNSANTEQGNILETVDAADIEEPPTLAYLEFPTQEIVSDIAYLFASRAITEALNRLSQPCPTSEEAETDRAMNDILHSGQNSAVTEDVTADEGSNSSGIRREEVGIGFTENGIGAEESSLISSEETKEKSEEMVVDDRNNTNCEELSLEVLNEEPIVGGVRDAIEFMVGIVAASEGIVSTEEKTGFLPVSELVATPVKVETELCMGIDDSDVSVDEHVCAKTPLPSAESNTLVDEVSLEADIVDSAVENNIESVTKPVIAEMINNVIAGTQEQNHRSETTQETELPDLSGGLESLLQNDEIQTMDSSLEISERNREPGLIADAASKKTDSTPGPELENQGPGFSLANESPTVVESRNEVVGLDSNVDGHVPAGANCILETSNVKGNGDQVEGVFNVIDSIFGDIVTAIESFHQVDEAGDDVKADIGDLPVLAQPCTHVSTGAILPSALTETHLVEANGESTETKAEPVEENFEPETQDEVSEVYQLDAVECKFASLHSNSVEDKDAAVEFALQNLVNAIAEATPTTVQSTSLSNGVSDEEGQCNENLVIVNSDGDGTVDTPTATKLSETEMDTSSPDNWELSVGSHDLAVQSGVKRVVADLCTSVERKYASRHGARARSVHFAGGTKDESFDRQKQMRRSVLLWEAPIDTASTKESVESSAKRRASKRRVSRRALADLLAFPTELARFMSSDTTLLAYDARLEQGPIFSLLDQSILTINPDGRHIDLDDQDERLGSKVIGKRRTLTQELHSKNLALRQIPRFNYMPMSIKFQWSDFVVATPVRPSSISFGEGHIAKSPVEPMRLLQKKGSKLPCGSYVIVSAFIRPLEDGNENLRVQIYDAERVEEFQFDFSEDIMKKYHLESTGIEAQSLEFLGHLEFRRDEDTIIIKLPEKKAGEGSKEDADRIQSERTMVGAGDPRNRDPPSKQSRMAAYRQKRPSSSPSVTTCQDSPESSSSREPSYAEQIPELDRDLPPIQPSYADDSEAADLDCSS